MFGKFIIDFQELGLMSGMLDTWHPPEAKLLSRILLNSSAFLFSEHSDFGQVCEKYFCVPGVLCPFLIHGANTDPANPTENFKDHSLILKMVLRSWCLLVFCLGIFLCSPVITV